MILQNVLHHVFLQTIFGGVMGEFVCWKGEGCFKYGDI